MAEHIKVLHLHFGRDGGAERFFVHLVNGLARRGVQQTSIIRPRRIWRPLIENSTTIIESHYRNLSLDKFLLPRKVNRIAKNWKPDAMIAWTPKGCKLMPPSFGGRKIIRLGDYPHSLRRFVDMDTIVANTPDIIARMQKLGWRKSTKVISNFTSTEKVAAVDRHSIGVPKEVFLVSAIGRFVQRKGFDTLVKALEKLPNTHLLLVGDGEEKNNLMSLARSLNIEHRMHFTGWQNDIKPILAASDIFVLPSRHEPLGNVALEAWAQEIPVVSTRSEGPSWFMNDNVDSLLIDIDDVTGLSMAIEKLQLNADLRLRLAKGGSKTLEEMFSEDAITDAYISLITNKPGRSRQDIGT